MYAFRTGSVKANARQADFMANLTLFLSTAPPVSVPAFPYVMRPKI
jgi:hypothetical protein